MGSGLFVLFIFELFVFELDNDSFLRLAIEYMQLTEQFEIAF